MGKSRVLSPHWERSLDLSQRHQERVKNYKNLIHPTELPDVEEYVQLKRTVILQLSLSEAEECYQLWGHISCNTYLAHSYVDKILAEQRPSLDTSSLDSVRSES
ncbi:hypothetical protein DPMN_121179 [Dreissena polymorpha]|uniref:Uncharacterized protein n=1 Tax=Dreissena polymorpha TaxID=45954 RepID=A0A9D4GLM6_DREPO|nr:hypothetical protein DPMN_121179 [Dreissena polymorpha]